MSTALELLKRAFREGNLIPIGQAPTANEQVEGLDLLNAYMLAQFSTAVGEKLIEWPVPCKQTTSSVNRIYPLLPGADRTLVPTYPNLVPDNAQIIWDGSDQTVYLSEKPQDGAVVAVAKGSGRAAANVGTLTVDGNGRLISGVDTQTFTVAGFAPAQWFYRSDLAEWRPIVKLALGDAMLFPDEFDDLWVCAVSIRLAPRYGKQINQVTASRGAEMVAMLQQRYFQTRPTGSGGELLVPGFESFNTSQRSWAT